VTYRIESLDLDGCGAAPTRVYDLPPAPDYWPAVTDVSCPECAYGTIRWAEAGYVPGYRVCDGCGRHYVAGGTRETPTLLRVGSRRGWPASMVRHDHVALLRAAIAASGLSARRYATEVLTRDERTVRRWLAGKSPIPRAVLRYLQGQATPKVAA